MNSKVHRAISSAPEIERVLEETKKTSFTERIINTPVKHMGKIKFPTYEEKSDSCHYITAFTIAMGRTQFSDEERDAGYSQIFVENLNGAVFSWFSRLEAKSVDNFHQTLLLVHRKKVRQTPTSGLIARAEGNLANPHGYIQRCGLSCYGS